MEQIEQIDTQWTPTTGSVTSLLCNSLTPLNASDAAAPAVSIRKRVSGGEVEQPLVVSPIQPPALQVAVTPAHHDVAVDAAVAAPQPSALAIVTMLRRRARDADDAAEGAAQPPAAPRRHETFESAAKTDAEVQWEKFGVVARAERSWVVIESELAGNLVSRPGNVPQGIKVGEARKQLPPNTCLMVLVRGKRGECNGWCYIYQPGMSQTALNALRVVARQEAVRAGVKDHILTREITAQNKAIFQEAKEDGVKDAQEAAAVVRSSEVMDKVTSAYRRQMASLRAPCMQAEQLFDFDSMGPCAPAL